jgi:putative transposase
VQVACRLLEGADSGYYALRCAAVGAGLAHRADPGRAHRLPGQLRRSPVHAELTLGLGLQVGHNQVEMLMARATIKGLPGTRRPRSRHKTPTATDLVEGCSPARHQIGCGSLTSPSIAPLAAS